METIRAGERMAIEPDIQSVVDKFARALDGPRLLFELYPSPRPAGSPAKKFRPLPAAITLGVTGAFEGFAEDLVASALHKQGFGWGYIAAHANLTNPTVAELVGILESIGIPVAPSSEWSTQLPKQGTAVTSWYQNNTSWDDVVRKSEGWMQVRHCLTHGLVNGLGPEVWPGPIDKRSIKNQQQNPKPSADEVLARTSSPNKRALYFWSAVCCARIYSVGASIAAEAVGLSFGDKVDVSSLQKFESV